MAFKNQTAFSVRSADQAAIHIVREIQAVGGGSALPRLHGDAFGVEHQAVHVEDDGEALGVHVLPRSECEIGKNDDDE